MYAQRPPFTSTITVCDVRGRRRHLEPIDETGVIADYEAGATLAAIRQHHNMG